ncbi:hypothetical protein BMF77_01980 [Dolichospermum sp. UHCC 0315A]|jgi:uncharacterized protein with HEPN domain|nr:hypothetical protein [Dolichospermum lemmermannii]MDB9435647.1 hypothetical protein [Dolichospermum lemmermannii CS-548]QEI41395.1 hypothetical protein BMF77_01980 [Dolichospermum sp. UHCC 0315A]
MNELDNMLIYKYLRVDVAVVWVTVQLSLPSLKAVVIKELEEMLG